MELTWLLRRTLVPQTSDSSTPQALQLIATGSYFSRRVPHALRAIFERCSGVRLSFAFFAASERRCATEPEPDGGVTAART